MTSGSTTDLKTREFVFLKEQRVGHLATADASGTPHVVPVCYALSKTSVYITIDEKPKTGKPLKRLQNIAENARVALTADRYDDEDWSKLAWVMIRGHAELLLADPEHKQAQTLLREKHVQLRTMALESLPVIAIRIDQISSWGVAK